MRVIGSTDIDDARAAAKRLAEEQEYAMSQQNVELARRAYEEVNSVRNREGRCGG